MTFPRSSRVLRAAMMAGLVATALTSGSAFAQDATVKIKSFMFMPMAVTIHAGDTVTWTNMDEEPHTVTSADGGMMFKSPALDTDDKFSFTFDKSGTYKYFCSIHPHMVGTIVVK